MKFPRIVLLLVVLASCILLVIASPVVITPFAESHHRKIPEIDSNVVKKILTGCSAGKVLLQIAVS